MRKFKFSLMLGVILTGLGVGILVYNIKYSHAIYVGEIDFHLAISNTWNNYIPNGLPGGARYCLWRNSTNAEGCLPENQRDNDVYKIPQQSWTVSYDIGGVKYTEIWTRTWKNPAKEEGWAWTVVTKDSTNNDIMTQKWLATNWYAFKVSGMGPTSGGKEHSVFVFDGRNIGDPANHTAITPGVMRRALYNAPQGQGAGGVKLLPPPSKSELDFDNPSNNQVKWHVAWQAEGDWCNPDGDGDGTRRNNNNYWYHGWLSYQQAVTPACITNQDRKNVMFGQQYQYMTVSKWKITIDM